MLDNIAYKDYKKKDDIHGTVLYPAVMVAPVQKDILEELTRSNPIQSLFDPFHGSGTALYEAMEISKDIRLIGCDINPLAHLITKVKLQGVSKSIYNDIEQLKTTLKSIEPEAYSFNNIDKWFREDIKVDLNKIRNAIMTIEDNTNRLYFWYMFCNIIRRYSNTRSSTYKLHIKQIDVINALKNNVLADFMRSVERNVAMFESSSSNYDLYKCDILEKITTFENDAFDVSITSPPYGDNHTTVTYGQFSMLALYWIDSKDLTLEGWELENYSRIDSRSLGGQKKEVQFDQFEMGLIKPYIDNICERKQSKVNYFFRDYFLFLRELCRVTNQYIVLTLGNRTVDGVVINLTSITKKYLENNNFKNINQYEREILQKRTPKVLSSIDGKTIKSMNKEYMIIHKKGN